MNHGGFSAELRTDVLKFNGGLFADPGALPLDKTQIDLLLDAARADWRHVEPAIFGTLLERALDPLERHQLGAHYTPRAYVERLVMPTVIEPLREDWAVAQAIALQHDRDGKRDKAVAELRAFHRRLCQVRVLDPACGSGNFLYVTLEHLKRLEGEVLNALEALGETQGLLELAGVTVDPHQMLGLETNPRAARVAEAVLWIGYLQWHFRTHGRVNPPEPVLRDFHNIECRDAVLAWDRIEHVTDERGIPVTRWDGRTMKTHPVTGEPVPDETACVLLEKYVNPRKAEWPTTDFVVGNPPFIGKQNIRPALGDAYVEALRAVWADVPDSADYVMYWWHHAAEEARGLVRWLRPEFQNPGGAQAAQGEWKPARKPQPLPYRRKNSPGPKRSPNRSRRCAARWSRRPARSPPNNSRAASPARRRKRCRNCWKPWSPWARPPATPTAATALRARTSMLHYAALTRRRKNNQGDFYACRKCNSRKNNIDYILGVYAMEIRFVNKYVLGGLEKS